MRVTNAFNNNQPEKLPEWDLSAFYNGIDDPKIEADLARAKQLATDFAGAYKGRLATLDGNGIADALDAYDAYLDVIGGVAAYASILKSKDFVANGKFATAIAEKTTEIDNLTKFFELELGQLPDDVFALQSQSPRLTRYAEWLRQLRASKPYMLSEGEEKIVTTMNLTGKSAWSKLFGETMSSLEYPFDGEKLNQSQILKVIQYDPDRKRREAAYNVFSSTLAGASRVLTFITNTLAQDKSNADKMRGYPNMVRSRNDSNNIEDDVVNALAAAVVAGYPATSHRYYEIKRRELGFDKLTPFDRSCPIADESAIKTPSFAEAKDIVLDSFAAFSPDMERIARKFFDNNWIDAPAGKAKKGGAFAAPMVVSKHPVMLMNWTGARRDMATLGHELGHNIHQYLAAETQRNNMLTDTPLTLAETASVFGERLIFERELAKQTDPAVRKAMLAAKIEDMIATVVRQVAFFEFEKAVHGKRRTEGEMTADEIGDLWLKTQQESFGPSVELDERYKSHWSYIPHFINSPFYVYAYAFGDCLVNALYEIYEKTPDGQKPAFVDKYLDLLRAGGTKHHSEALKPFGIDLSDPAFWQNGIRTISGMIDRLEIEIAREKALKAAPAPKVS